MIRNCHPYDSSDDRNEPREDYALRRDLRIEASHAATWAALKPVMEQVNTEALARRFARDPDAFHTASDIAQDMHEQCWRARGAILTANNPVGYAVTTCRNVAIRKAQENAAETAFIDRTPLDEIPAEPPAPPPDCPYTFALVRHIIRNYPALEADARGPALSSPSGMPRGGRRECDRGIDGNGLLLALVDVAGAIQRIDDPRLREVLRLRCAGLSYPAIGNRRKMKSVTVRDWCARSGPAKIVDLLSTKQASARINDSKKAA